MYVLIVTRPLERVWRNSGFVIKFKVVSHLAQCGQRGPIWVNFFATQSMNLISVINEIWLSFKSIYSTPGFHMPNVVFTLHKHS